MRQSRLMSLLEATTNVVVGYALAVWVQVLVFPLFGLHTTLRQSLGVGAIFPSSRSSGAICCGACSRPSLVRWSGLDGLIA
jgi:hypothetical protein